jgi:hypothetical protein
MGSKSINETKVSGYQVFQIQASLQTHIVLNWMG